MGQRSPCIVYGCVTDEDIVLYEDEFEPEYREVGLLPEYRDATGNKPPVQLYETDTPSICYLVAIGGSGEDGIPDIEPCAIDEIKTFYADSYKDAVKKWKAFAAWCLKVKGIKLPKAKLYLSETETA